MEICSICRENMDTMTNLGSKNSSQLRAAGIHKTECSHYFHGKCLSGWLKNGTKCPLCQRDIAAEKWRLQWSKG